jgi:methyltransferase family protein
VLKHRVVTFLAQHAPRVLPLRHLGRYHNSRKFFIGDDDEYAGVDYAAVYASYLGRWRRKGITLLELGVYRGDSLRTWRDYFPNAEILGLDIDPEAARRAPGFTVYTGSQADPDLLAQVKRDHPRIDVIVDDASHLNELTVASFRALYPHLAPGGYYIIEDVPRGSGSASKVDSPSGVDYNVVDLVNRREDIDSLIVELAREVEEGRQRTVDFLHVWPRMIVVRKPAAP